MENRARQITVNKTSCAITDLVGAIARIYKFHPFLFKRLRRINLFRIIIPGGALPDSAPDGLNGFLQGVAGQQSVGVCDDLSGK